MEFNIGHLLKDYHILIFPRDQSKKLGYYKTRFLLYVF